MAATGGEEAVPRSGVVAGGERIFGRGPDQVPVDRFRQWFRLDRRLGFGGKLRFGGFVRLLGLSGSDGLPRVPRAVASSGDRHLLDPGRPLLDLGRFQARLYGKGAQLLGVTDVAGLLPVRLHEPVVHGLVQPTVASERTSGRCPMMRP